MKEKSTREEAEQRVGEELYRSILQTTTDGFWIVSEAGKILDVNDVYTTMSGYSRAELLEMSITQLENKETESETRYHIEEIIKKGWGRFDSEHRRKDGSTFDVEISTTFLPKDDKFIVFVRDITSINMDEDFLLSQVRDYKISQELLLESEERYKALHDASSGGVIIHDKGLILDCNQGLSEMTGFTNKELIGMDGLKLIAPDSLDQVLQNIKAGYDQRYEVEGVRKDGSVYPLSIKGKNVRYKGCEVRVIEFWDITDRKKMEEELSQRRAEFEAIFNSITDAIVFVDQQRQIIMVNPAFTRILGYNLEEVVGKTTQIIYADPESYLKQGKARFTPNAVIDNHVFENEYRRKDGTVFQGETLGIHVKNQEGNVLGFLGVIRDITEQRRIEEELAQSHKMEAIGTLAGGIAHDFNNILSAIVGYAEIARYDLPADSNAVKDLDEVLKASSRATELVKQILAFSRKTTHQLKPLLPHLLIKEVLKMLRSSMPATIEFQADIDVECGMVMADPVAIHQIIVNLCTNSLHAMKAQKGMIRVSLQRKELSADEITGEQGLSPGPFIVMEVSDTGQGMDQVTIERIFEPYFTTKKVGEGTGLGLAVIHGIVQDYHGFIRVQSEVGQGTTFSVYIPALQQEESTAEAIETNDMQLTGTERILIVDDEEMLLKVNKTVLGRLGYQVSTTTGSLDALEKFRTDPDRFDLVITDQTMPVMTGSELAQEIMIIKPNMPVILYTGYSSVFPEEAARAIGIKKYVRKPVDGAMLSRIVREVLDEA